MEVGILFRLIVCTLCIIILTYLIHIYNFLYVVFPVSSIAKSPRHSHEGFVVAVFIVVVVIVAVTFFVIVSLFNFSCQILVLSGFFFIIISLVVLLLLVGTALSII